MHWLFVSVISKGELGSIKPDLQAARKTTEDRLCRASFIRKRDMVLLQALSFLKREVFQPVSPGIDRRWTTAGRAGCAGSGRKPKCRGYLLRAITTPSPLKQMLEMDMCVLPSLTESFCKARLDAFLCGVPVITTGVGFGREIIGEDGERG